jgi:hypothetical protein
MQPAPAVQAVPLQAAPGVQPAPAGQAPSLQTQPAPGLNGGAAPPTYSPNSNGQYQENRPIPDNRINGASGGQAGSSPWLIDPDSRTTQAPARPNVQTAVYPDRPSVRPVPPANLVAPALHVAPAKAIDDGGWRAARR